RGLDLPLLIGGATTSRQHTAVKVAPEYGNPTVHVLDASRVVGVVSALLDPERRATLNDENLVDQERLRVQHAARDAKPMLAIAEARARRTPVEWRAEDLAVPAFLGLRQIERQPLEELVPAIDWTFFFHVWELKGKYPAILDDPRLGAAARELFANGQELLDRIVHERLLEARGVYGFWPANADGDDIVLFTDEDRDQELARFPMLRQQADHQDERPNRSLADFVAPLETGLRDYVGAFAVTAGVGTDELAGAFEAENDDYNAILTKALADRLAESFATVLHERVRREWYQTETLTPEQLIAEKHRGIRPAFGYPACPDHTEKGTLFDLLGARELGIELTEHFAMTPTAAVSGIYLGHPASKYFAVGRVAPDQVADYAARKGSSVEVVERWLAPNLGYTP
ncbi:MAG: 5-methyltetrahydrofolate--homocysteine methyltransferase, partial [Gaiellaceae bacterium]|nr:5-methyltetrahydrofolate--homocysteine methyltransferase [Gaiellaceae bacterium]